jgi:hypothetical protein
LVGALIDDCFSILLQASASAYLDQCPNNALIFTVTKLKLSQQAVAKVSYGLNSIDYTPGLEHFKLRMGFTKSPLKERIVLNPMATPLLALGGRKIIGRVARKHPHSDLWRKASTILSQN